MLVNSPHQLKEELKKIRPTKVAVAYIGANWKDYLIDVEALKEIIVSPTLGSNPDALEELLNLTWEQDISVYFLTNLHAKLYIGDDACLVGSANLSDNGFGGGLEEMAVVVEDKEILEQALSHFSRLRDNAISDEREQRRMAASLRKKWNEARRYGNLPNEGGDRPSTNLVDWKPGSERIILAWYTLEGSMKADAERIAEAVPALDKTQPPLEQFADYVNFVHGDDIRKDDWLLCWAAKKDGTPDKSTRAVLNWMQVDHVIPYGADESEDPYTTLAVMMSLSSEERRYKTPPFEIDDTVEALLYEILNSNNFKKLLRNDDIEWRVSDVLDENRRFLHQLQQAYRDEMSRD